MPSRAITTFLKLTVAFSTAPWILIIWSGHLYMGSGLVLPAMMWCPALAAFSTFRILRRDLRDFGWRWPERKYMILAYAIPLAYTSLAYGSVWASHLAGWNSEFVSMISQDLGLTGSPRWVSFSLSMIFIATGGVIQNLATTLGEEIGWRGLLVPELAKHMSFTMASLVSGAIWAAWHVPLLLFADYNAGTNRWYALACSSITCISLSFILAWLRLQSDSLWPAALLHASHNVFVPIVFDNLVRNIGPTPWYTTVFGIALPITSALFAVYFWIRGIQNRSPQPVWVSKDAVCA